MADYQYINNTGVIIPDTETLLIEVQDEFKNAFGADMSTDPSTPQGLLITGETIARKKVVDNNAALANQINPNVAGGVFLDAICALTGLRRAVALPSLLKSVELTGVSGAIIPAGVRARTTDFEFESISTAIIALDGTAIVDFQSVDLGAIPCGIGDLNTIVTTVLGWETVTNPDVAILGTDEQSDESLRSLRRNTLALQGVALVESIISALYDTIGVRSLQFRENIASTIQVIDGITMIPHSIWACVDGGTDEAIGEALLNNKSLGAGYNGVQVVNVVEPISGQTYVVNFDRPDPISVICRITVKVNASLVNPVTSVKEAIILWANGGVNGEDGLTVGTPVSPFEIGATVNSQIQGIYIQLVELSYETPVAWQSTELAIAIDEIAILVAGGITVVIV